MEKTPREWVDRIFVLMEQFFGDQWTASLKDDHSTEIHKVNWQTGLMGLTKEEIKKALKVCKYLSLNYQKPPNLVDFYHYSKGIRLPVKKKAQDYVQSNPQVARDAIDQIKKSLFCIK